MDCDATTAWQADGPHPALDALSLEGIRTMWLERSGLSISGRIGANLQLSSRDVPSRLSVHAVLRPAMPTLLSFLDFSVATRVLMSSRRKAELLE